jgi:endoglucanase
MQLALGVALAAFDVPSSEALQNRNKRVDHSKLPRWRGFNLLEKFTLQQNAPFVETDFDIIREWGFDFVRLPMDYRTWTDPDDPYRLIEKTLKEIDDAVRYGRERGIHVNLNFHRGPGYCVNPPKEPLDLWTDSEAQKRFVYHWASFAKRYKGIPSSELSFDLLNEPGMMGVEPYVKVVTATVEAIRSADPDRLVIADGIRWGNQPVPELASLKIAQSTRGYAPMQISHFRASWIGGSDKWEVPTWPLKEEGGWDRERLRRIQIEPWKALEKLGVGVHVGEWGAYQYTPHPVVLAWMTDQLTLWKEAGWGWAMWNLRGSFGPLDSNRADVQYETFHGHKLDRKMLELIQTI